MKATVKVPVATNRAKMIPNRVPAGRPGLEDEAFDNVGAAEGVEVGGDDGSREGSEVGGCEGSDEGGCEGNEVGSMEGSGEGRAVGDSKLSLATRCDECMLSSLEKWLIKSQHQGSS